MLRWLFGLDGLVARTRPAWAWLGQLAVVLLGVHLAADRLDDGISVALAGSGIPWPEPDQPLTLGTWTAVLLELYVAGWVTIASVRANEDAVATPRAWLDRASLHGIAAPIVWAPTSLAGAWVIGMATEDLVADLWPAGAAAIGWLVAALVVWRIVAPGLIRIVRATPIPGHRWDGAVTIWPAVLIGGLAIRYGLPVWGWLP